MHGSNTNRHPHAMHATVIVPCKDAEATIEETLASLARQTEERPWELIVADNGSTDATLDIVRRWQDRIDAVRIVDASDRPGAGHARNVASSSARGDVLAFLDADDVVESGWLAALSRGVPPEGLAASRFVGREINDDAARDVRSTPQTETLMDFQYASFLPFASASGLAVRREDFQDLGGFDESVLAGEDIDLCWRAQLEGRPLCFVDDAVLHYRLRRATEDVVGQVHNYGYWTAALVARYGDKGLSGSRVRSGVRAWWSLLIRVPKLGDPAVRAKWRKDLGYRVGLIRGSIAHRTVAL